MQEALARMNRASTTLKNRSLDAELLARQQNAAAAQVSAPGMFSWNRGEKQAAFDRAQARLTALWQQEEQAARRSRMARVATGIAQLRADAVAATVSSQQAALQVAEQTLAQEIAQVNQQALQWKASAMASPLTQAQVDDYRSGNLNAIWGRETVDGVARRMNVTLLQLDPTFQDLHRMFDEWTRLYEQVIDAVADAYRELNRIQGQYVQTVDERRRMYIGIATGLLKIGADLVGAGKVVDLLGQVFDYVWQQVENNSFAGQVIEAAARLGSNEVVQVFTPYVPGAADVQEELQDDITNSIADKVESTINTKTLPEMRERIQAGAAPTDVLPLLDKIKGSVSNSIDKLKACVSDSLKTNLVLDEQDALALLSVGKHELGMAALLEAPAVGLGALQAIHNQVLKWAWDYCDARAAHTYNQIFDRYECPCASDATRLGTLRTIMEKWVLAQFVASADERTLRDMSNATTGLINWQEGALLQKLIGLGVLARRPDQRSLSDLTAGERAANIAVAESMQTFNISYSSVGPSSIAAMKAWARSVLKKTPVEYALTV
jgi:hypothetical protein